MIDITTDNNSVFVTVNGKIFRYAFCDDNGVSIIRFLPTQKPICFSSDFAAILSFLTKDLSAKITLQNICTEFYTNKRAIEKLFRENVEMSYYDYMTELKLGISIAMLFTPQSSISEIATETGFSTPQNFSKFFSKHIGFPPTEFRAVLRSKIIEMLNDLRTKDFAKSEQTQGVCLYVQATDSAKNPIKSSISVTPPPQNSRFRRLEE